MLLVSVTLPPPSYSQPLSRHPAPPTAQFLREPCPASPVSHRRHELPLVLSPAPHTQGLCHLHLPQCHPALPLPRWAPTPGSPAQHRRQTHPLRGSGTVGQHHRPVRPTEASPARQTTINGAGHLSSNSTSPSWDQTRLKPLQLPTHQSEGDYESLTRHYECPQPPEPAELSSRAAACTGGSPCSRDASRLRDPLPST